MPKRFVYILKSLLTEHEHYVGLTSDPDERLRAHNAGLSPHTEQRPWRIPVCIEFDEEAPAVEFERYLKSGVWPGVREAPLPTNRRRRTIDMKPARHPKPLAIVVIFRCSPTGGARA